MTDLRKAAQMALDWRDKNSELLFELGGWDFIFEINDWSQSIRGALAQPEQEPVAWWHDMGDVVDLNVSGRGTPLYFAPPQRDETPAKAVEWQGLTDEEVIKLGRLDKDSDYFGLWYDFAQAIEAKLKEKNGG